MLDISFFSPVSIVDIQDISFESQTLIVLSNDADTNFFGSNSYGQSIPNISITGPLC